MTRIFPSTSIMLIIALFGLSPSSNANDFPTLERVKYVQECMSLNGGPTYVNMYGCSCVLDKIAAEMSFDDFVHADAFARLRNMRGERGGYFRSSKDSRSARKELTALRDEATQQCFVTQQITRVQ
ncbi:hypothetical protein [Enterovibrio norvegicus]|uniref:hypothetical protein n=1 Tax=Enterovibrio norvegicus TaxID=188144 RepID=UPI000C8221F9|nr:hypothetical protein [Enterovibrio norvegicus]PMH65536.1 hypothetical protein BCU62_12230 [Enterovibrio norvegicus]TKF30886.1 hypothetical protein FCV83_17305 [Enterovibrio norvegicus]